MNVGETLDMLINAENYAIERVNISDQFIEMAKAMLSDYRFIAEKEENYQEYILSIKQMKKNI